MSDSRTVVREIGVLLFALSVLFLGSAKYIPSADRVLPVPNTFSTYI